MQFSGCVCIFTEVESYWSWGDHKCKSKHEEKRHFISQKDRGSWVYRADYDAYVLLLFQQGMFAQKILVEFAHYWWTSRVLPIIEQTEKVVTENNVEFRPG